MANPSARFIHEEWHLRIRRKKMTTGKRLPAPPYVGFKTFMTFLDWLGQVGVPSRIDRSFWGDRFSGAAGSQVIATLRFFGLIDKNGVPDPSLETMAKDPVQRKSSLAALMARYNEALDGLDLERATAGELDERFRRYDISGDTFRKAVVFFIQAAQYCGMPLSPYITKRKRITRGDAATAQPRRRGRPPKAKVEVREPEAREARVDQDVDSLGLHPSVAALLSDLNRIGSRWDQIQKDRWVSTFLAIIDYAYPIREPEAPSSK
jgi:hypothetical protein